jgi:Ser/Thr protein kinase RdoA (MazF antagonist)
MKQFRDLTRRSRLYRLREVAKKAVKVYGMDGARLTFIQYFENIIYRVDTPDFKVHSHEANHFIPNRYILRIHAMGDAEAIASELTWLAALHQEAGLSVPAPIPTPDGKLLTTIVTPGMPNGRYVSLMRWLDGRKISHGFRPKHLTALGQAVATMHTFSAGWHAPEGFIRPDWDWNSLFGGIMFRHSLEELVDSIPPESQQPFQIISDDAKRVMETFGKGPDAYGLIHADLYPENVLFKAGKAFPIDFEDCGYGYWMCDIAVALCKWAWGNEWEVMRDAFREGYAEIRTLPEAQWQQLDLFIATQFATMVLWASEFLMRDPKRVAEYTPWREENCHKLSVYFSRQK